MFNHDGLTSRLVRLGEILFDYQQLWQPRAFHHLQLPWESSYPKLSDYLRSLSYEQAVALQAGDDALLEALTPYLPIVTELRELIQFPVLPESRPYDYPSRLISEIPGRKLSQIDAFLNAVNLDGNSIVDWCSGKGHLSRLAACRLMTADNQIKSIIGLEFNPGLVKSGNSLAQHQRLPVCIHHVDVMSNRVDHYMNHESQVMALHACGDLHLQLLRKAVEHHCAAVNLSPCCYHLVAEDFYQPLSSLAENQIQNNRAPSLSKDNLRTAVQQTITAPGYVREQREKMQAWRLGFDLLQRVIFQTNGYLPLPVLPTVLSKGSFKEFCQHVSDLKAVQLPTNVNFNDWEHKGLQRFVEVTQLDLARLAFRRAMEVWLILDRAQYLIENGYKVEVLQFCRGQLTPRNFLINATILFQRRACAPDPDYQVYCDDDFR